MTAKRTAFRHVLDRYGLWDEAILTPPRNEFGPLVNLGLYQMLWWGERARTRRFIRTATREELATFIALLAAIGCDLVDLPFPEFIALARANRGRI